MVFLRSKVNKLESELAKYKTENDQLIFDLRITKTKAACLEEKLAQTEFKDPIRTSPTQVNVTVNANNYGCFGLGGFGNLKIRLESPHKQTKDQKFAPRIKVSQSASKNSDDSSNVHPEAEACVTRGENDNKQVTSFQKSPHQYRGVKTGFSSPPSKFA